MDQNTKTSSLTPIGQLFSASWNTFTHSLLQLILLNILGIVVYILTGILAFVILILTGIGSAILQKGLAGLSSITPQTITTLGIVGLILFIIFLIISAAMQVTSVLIVDSNGQGPFAEKFKKSFGFILPLFLINFISGILIIGGFFLLVLPGILFAILFSFVSFEVILGNQKSLAALKQSAAIVSKNFGGIFLRYLLLFLISVGVSILISILDNILPKDAQIFTKILSFLFNSFWGLFSLCFSINLYKQAKASVSQNQPGGIVWILALSILGWLIAIGIIFASWKVISSGIFNKLAAQNPQRPGISIQKSIDEMSPEAKINFDKSAALFKQMQEVQKSGKSDAQIVAETKKLNDENIAELKKALEIDSNNAKIFYELGNAYTWISTTGTLEDGLSAYQNAEQLDPDNVVYINGVGDMLIRLGKYEEAILHFQKTLRLTDKSGFANLSVAQAYANLKIYDSAREHYQKAIDIFTGENQNGNYDSYILQAKKGIASLPK